MTINYDVLGKRIKEYRRIKGYSQAKLAELSKVSVSYIAKVEVGIRKLNLESAVNICEAFDITLNQLLVGNTNPTNDDYLEDYTFILSNCNRYEKRIIIDILYATKNTLVNNREYLKTVYADSIHDEFIKNFDNEK